MRPSPCPRSHVPASVLLTAVLVAGCATVGPRDASRDPAVGELITADEIRKTGARNAWEALKNTVSRYRFDDYRGEPTRISSVRGNGSILFHETPKIFVDGAQLTEYQVLRTMPAYTIASIRVLNGSDGTTYYGTGSVAGVILIETGMRDGGTDDERRIGGSA